MIQSLTLMFFNRKGSLQYLQLSVLSGHSLSLWRSCSLALISSLQEGHRMIMKSQLPSWLACGWPTPNFQHFLSIIIIFNYCFDELGCTFDLMMPLTVNGSQVVCVHVRTYLTLGLNLPCKRPRVVETSSIQ